MKYKLLAVDVDGTLLDDEHRLSENNRRAIRAIREEGVKVIPFSGRGYPALKRIIETLKLEEAVVTQNGSLVLDNTGNKILHAELISSENCTKILDYCRAHLYQPLIYQEDQVYSGLKGTYLEIFEKCMGQRVVYTEDVGMCYNNTPLGKILILDEPCRVTQFREWVSAAFGGVVSADRAYDFSLELGGSDKGRALAWIGSYYHIEPGEMVAIGDGENDKSMLEYAGLSIAMQGAMEGVKQAAGKVTLSNNESGVAYAIEKYVRCKIS